MTASDRDSGAHKDANTSVRAIRVSDGLWRASQAKAKAEGTTVAEVIRDALTRWTGYSGPGVHGRDYSKK